ncbi:MAG: N-succinyldiaminopimelate aminotransferase [Actinomycetota bacterium]
MDGLETICETFCDPRTQLVEPFARQRGDLYGIREAIREPAAAQSVDRVDLVHDHLERQIVSADVAQHGPDRRFLFVEPIVRSGSVDDEKNEVRDERFLQRRCESLDELSRQTADETDRVRYEITSSLVLERACRRVQRLEEAVVDRDVRLRQGIQQRRLADVRVAGQSDGRRFGALTFLATNVPLLAQVLQAPAQERDPAARNAPVGLELRLAGPSCPDARSEGAHAAAEALEVLPQPSHAWQVVLELRQLDLELSLRASRMLGEDVEDQLRPVDDACLEGVLERALLDRVELVVHQEHLGAGFLVGALELLELPLPDVGTPLGARPVLDELPDRLDEGCVRELTQLGQLPHGIDSLGQHRDDEPALERGVRLALGHGWIMATRQNPTMAPLPLSPALAATGTYPFVKLEEAKRRLAAEGVELIDFGKGDPREPTDPMIRQALADSITTISTYPLAEGLPELRAAVADWCARRFGVELDPGTEIIPTYGSKEAIFLLAQLLIDREGDRRLVVTTEPGYPVPERGAAFAGADVLQLPLLEENGFLPDLDAVSAATWRQAAIVWINYPNNPTGAVAPLDFLERLAELSEEHGFLLAADEAYTELWFDVAPHSALEARTRGNIAVFNTLSKRSSMTGYRSGFVAANADLIAALKQFRPSVGTAPQEFVQRASVVAWNDEEHVDRTRAAYGRKRDALLPTLARKGIRLAGSEATMYLWLEVPGGERSETFAGRLLERGLIVSPGTFFGPTGEGYWRLALVPTEQECRRAAEILEDVL